MRSLEPSLLQNQQAQLLQPFFIEEMLHPSVQFHGPHHMYIYYLLQYVFVYLSPSKLVCEFHGTHDHGHPVHYNL